jgi:hypothetical protein
MPIHSGQVPVGISHPSIQGDLCVSQIDTKTWHQMINGGTTLRGLLTPRSAPFRCCHVRNGHVYAARRSIHGSSKRPHEVLGTAARQPEAEPLPVQKPNDRVTVKDIRARRAKAGKLVAGVAAYCDSDMFKAPVSCRVTIDEIQWALTKRYM